ncbi:IclR family transcriptional regulator [Lacisediminimonas profundi]|uniref:IclR family transcriptional regulator n=1 Tax=Lacisediminimonas profundi TaxID=2603856 RepID=UPI00124B73E2|nr:IclR family transcriptional regulator C-terminal domain-containing protein [Lacisediminimonas profundi]
MPQIIPTAQRALQVFEVFAREQRPLTNSEMARYLDLADSSCSDLLFTLRQAGFLLRTPKSRHFHPTGRLLNIAQGIAASDSLQIFASEALEILMRQSGESAMCGHIDGNKVKIFACKESSRALRYVLRPGTVLEVQGTSLGKALLGAMEPDERNALIDALPMIATTPKTITQRDALRAEIEATNQGNKCFIAKEEGVEGVFAIAIAGKVGDRLTALSIVGPTHRVSQNIDACIKILTEARAEFFES